MALLRIEDAELSRSRFIEYLKESLSLVVLLTEEYQIQSCDSHNKKAGGIPLAFVHIV